MRIVTDRTEALIVVDDVKASTLSSALRSAGGRP
jgi:hypothetical protein